MFVKYSAIRMAYIYINSERNCLLFVCVCVCVFFLASYLLKKAANTKFNYIYIANNILQLQTYVVCHTFVWKDALYIYIYIFDFTHNNAINAACRSANNFDPFISLIYVVYPHFVYIYTE